MLKLAFGLLCIAAAIGGGLAVAYLRGGRARPPVAAVHGGLGAASLLALLAARIPSHGMGTAGFGRIAAALLGLALVLGLSFALRRRRPAGAVVGAHAGLAIAALVVLLTLVALG